MDGANTILSGTGVVQGCSAQCPRRIRKQAVHGLRPSPRSHRRTRFRQIRNRAILGARPLPRQPLLALLYLLHPCSRRSHRQWAQIAAMSDVTLGAMPPSPKGRHRTWRKRLRRWRLGNSMSIVSCGGLAPPFEGASPRKGVALRHGIRRLPITELRDAKLDSRSVLNQAKPVSLSLRSVGLVACWSAVSSPISPLR